MSQRYLGGIITANPTAPTLTSASGVWTTEQQFQNIANWPKSTGLVSRSVRLRSSASAYFNRTPAGASNRKTWTWSGWVKRGSLGAAQILLSSDVGTSNSTWLEFGFDAADTFTITSYTTDSNTTAAVFRDPSSWYHIVVAFDSTQATSANRCKIYVNGTQQTLTGAGFTLNADYGINNAQAHAIGYRNWSTPGRYFDGYLTEINFIDGQALTPSYFGFTDGNGVWQPATYSGTYGTNGFYLNFSDNSATDALGYDFSTGLYSKNLRTSGTNIGTFTANGGLAAAFDGNFNQPNASSAKVSTPAAGYNTAVIGKDWGAGVTKTITAVQLFSQNDGGFVGGTTTALVFKLQGSNDNSTWTDLTSPITGPATGANTIITVTSGITTSTAYRYHRINVNADGANNYYMCELAFYEAGSYNLNNWFPNNISLTAGATYDSMLDVPTPYADGGNGRGNYCVLNPLDWVLATNTITDGNLNITTSASNISAALGTIAVSSGKWYFEFTPTSVTGLPQIGIVKTPVGTISTNGIGQSANAYVYLSNGNKGNNNSFTAYGATYTNADVIGVALDLDAGTLVFYKNNASQGTAFTSLSGEFFPVIGDAGAASTIAGNINFGQRPFTYTPPTGFVALNTQNLPTPTISNGATVMAATTYTGTGATQTISNAVNGVSFQPDFVWVKGRSGATDNALYDAVRGVQLQIESNTITAETTETTGLTAFGSTGFTIGALAQMNTNAATYVGWQWNAGGSTVTNTNGSISAQVRANATAGFSIVTYTGTGANATVGHGLGVAPKMLIVRSRNNGSATNWAVWHTSFSSTEYIYLNSTAAKSSSGGAALWNSTLPTSSVFSIGTDTNTNYSTTNIVAYCFAAVAGYSAFGSYTGNGSTDGPFVFTGFRPRWVMIRNPAIVANWLIFDSSRDTYNPEVLFVFANTSDAEQNSSASVALDFVSNGFKIRQTSGNINASGNALIYMAFAENPFKLSRAR